MVLRHRGYGYVSVPFPALPPSIPIVSHRSPSIRHRRLKPAPLLLPQSNHLPTPSGRWAIAMRHSLLVPARLVDSCGVCPVENAPAFSLEKGKLYGQQRRWPPSWMLPSARCHQLPRAAPLTYAHRRLGLRVRRVDHAVHGTAYSGIPQSASDQATAQPHGDRHRHGQRQQVDRRPTYTASDFGMGENHSRRRPGRAEAQGSR